MRYCPECGTKNQDISKFCKKCGTEILEIENNPNQQETPKDNPNILENENVINGMIVEEKVGLGGTPKVEQQQGTALLKEDAIVISKRSFWRGVDRGEKHIRYEDISAADLDRKGIISPGAIQIYTSGHQVSIRKNKAKKLEPFFKELTKRINEAKAKKTIPNQSNESSQADELRKFAQLRDEGIITDEEFKTKKKEILGL